MTDEELGRRVREMNWDIAILGFVRSTLELRLARHPKVGAALSYKEGEELISALAVDLTYNTHRIIDPDYDQ